MPKYDSNGRFIPPHERSEEEKDKLLFTKQQRQFMSGEPPKPRAKPTHAEADLHLAFCKWVKLQYPKLQFIRHEREKARSPYMQMLFKQYNGEFDKMPDFELIEPCRLVFKYDGVECYNDIANRLYLEFKRPGTTLTLRDGITIKPAYSRQYECHKMLWDKGSCAYFACSFDEAIELFLAYINHTPKPMQKFKIK